MNYSDEHTAEQRARGEITTLDRILPPGACSVVSVTAQGSVRQRLFALGIVPGAIVEAVRAAPLGDPVEYRVKGYILSFRREEARLISVIPGGA